MNTKAIEGKKNIMEIARAGMLYALRVGELCMHPNEFRRFKKLVLDHFHKSVEPQLKQELELISSEKIGVSCRQSK